MAWTAPAPESEKVLPTVLAGPDRQSGIVKLLRRPSGGGRHVGINRGSLPVALAKYHRPAFHRHNAGAARAVSLAGHLGSGGHRLEAAPKVLGQSGPAVSRRQHWVCRGAHLLVTRLTTVSHSAPSGQDLLVPGESQGRQVRRAEKPHVQGLIASFQVAPRLAGGEGCHHHGMAGLGK